MVHGGGSRGGSSRVTSTSTNSTTRNSGSGSGSRVPSNRVGHGGSGRVVNEVRNGGGGSRANGNMTTTIRSGGGSRNTITSTATSSSAERNRGGTRSGVINTVGASTSRSAAGHGGGSRARTSSPVRHGGGTRGGVINTVGAGASTSRSEGHGGGSRVRASSPVGHGGGSRSSSRPTRNSSPIRHVHSRTYNAPSRGSRMDRPINRARSDDEDCCGPCSLLCCIFGAFFGFLACLCGNIKSCCFGRSRTEERSTEQPRVEEDGNTCGRCFCKFLACVCGPVRRSHRSTVPLFLVTVILASLLIIMSGQNETWTLNAGESRQIVPAWWTRDVDIQVISPHTSVDVSVFAFSNKCPPLTGPIVQVDEERSMAFEPGDYQYDYFYLNKGSKVEAALSQTQGNSITYLLRGQDKVSILENRPNDHQLEDLIRTATKSWKANDRQSQQTVARFRADRNDVHVLLYDNPYRNRGHLFADLYMDLTTYNLKGYDPFCTDIAFHPCPPVETEVAKCIIVDTWGHSGEQVTLRITGYRDYAFILMLSSIPAVLWIAWKLWSCLSSRRSPNREANDELTQPLMSPDPSTPTTASATARDPPTTTSAPPSTEDISIPIAEAEVIGGSSPAVATASVTPVEAPADEVDKSSSVV